MAFQYESLADEEAYVAIGVPSHALPAELIFNQSGLVTCCYHNEADEYYDHCFADKTNRDPEFFEKLFKEYGELIDELKKWNGLRRVWLRKELLHVLGILRRSCKGLFFSYCLPAIEDAPQKLKELAYHFREQEDQIGHPIRELIAQNLRALYPNQPLITLANSEELFSNEIPSDAILRTRAHEYLIENGKILSESLEEFLRQHRAEFAENKMPIDVSEFQGSVGYKGVVRGIVHVLGKIEEVVSFREGEILVTYMTTPEFLPATKKAAAIITNEGGITCHAAIVARELKKPCIIGTKIATQVLKDGDEVEVDADQGIIRILKH